MTATGGMATARASCSRGAVGGAGTPATGIRHGVTTLYVSYPYDGPIYTGYDYVAPDQVIINVQFALQDWGYYAGATDGVLGPQTRAALAAFQADNGLAVTSTVDEPTLQTLGVA